MRYHKWFTKEVINRLNIFTEYCICVNCNTEKLILSISDNPLMVMYKRENEHVWQLLQGSVVDCPWLCKEEKNG